MGSLLLSGLFKSKGQAAGRQAIGVAEHGFYVAKVKYVGGRPCLIRCEYHETGDISAVALERLRRSAKLDEQRCTTFLDYGEYQLSMVEAPVVPPDEIKTAIRWKIKDNLSYSVDEATVDVLRIPAGRFGAEREQSVYAVSASNEVVKRRIDLFRQAGIALEVIDIPEMALRNIAQLFELPGQALALLAFDEEGGMLTFTAGGELYLARHVDIGYRMLRDADEQMQQQYRDRVELEVQRSLDYFDRQFNHLPVSRLLVCAPSDTGLVEFLAPVSDVTVEPLDLSQVMDTGGLEALDESEFVARVLLTLGAALRHEGATR